MSIPHSNRRHFLLSTAATLGAGIASSPAHARYVSHEDGFQYEVQKSEQDWLHQLGPADYDILRKGGTEVPKSSSFWNQNIAGLYTCKGCALPLYDARWQVVLDKGWVFFNHSQNNAVLTGIDWPEGSEMADAFASLTAIEVHCRRCGGHLGHIVQLENQLLHCINGASLLFEAGTA